MPLHPLAALHVRALALPALVDHRLFAFLDLAGTFAFALSGAVAARERRLDGFGVLAVAFVVACGGGLLRDVSLGAVPPAGLTDWRYLAVASAAAVLAMAAGAKVSRLAQPVVLFDSLGLGFFAVTGAQKTMALTGNAEAALLLGMVTAVGGGVVRDLLLNRVPIILQREIYASAALLAAVIEVGGRATGMSPGLRSWLGIGACFALRALSLRWHWHLPRFGRGTDRRDRETGRAGAADDCHS